MPAHAGIVETGICKTTNGRFRATYKGRMKTFDTLEKAQEYRRKAGSKVLGIPKITRLPKELLEPKAGSYIVIVSKDAGLVKELLRDLEF